MEPNKKKTSGYEKTLETIKSTFNMPSQEAIEVLCGCVKKGYPLASQRAVRNLSEINHPAVVPSLIALYDWLEENSRKHDNGCDVRLAIAETLGDTGSPAAVDTLKKAARTVQIVKLGPGPEDAAISLRAAAALALAKIDPDCLYELALLLFDEKPNVPGTPYEKVPVRKAAAQAISVLGDSGGAPLLAVKLKFPNNEAPDVLAECLESLIFMRPPYLMEIVKPYLEGNDEYLSAVAALSLAENFREEVLDLLLEALERVSGEAKEAVIIAISATRCSKAQQILLDFLNHPDVYVCRGAMKGIETYH